jgi:hypothetical protein
VSFVRRGGCDSPLQHADESDRHTYIVVIADVLGLALSCAHFIGFQLVFKEAELLAAWQAKGDCGGKEGVKKEDGSPGGRREETGEAGMVVAAEIDFPRS